MLVAIIDDGIMPDMYGIGRLKYDMIVTKNGYIKRRKSTDEIATNHGTIIAGIIKKYAPLAEFCSIRVFSKVKDGKLITSSMQLYYAMRWCLKKNIPIVHLSLGTVTSNDFNDIISITNRLLRAGRIIVAAKHNNGMYTVPAQLPGVFGVRCDVCLTSNQVRELDIPGDVKFIASGIHELILPDGSSITTPPSNSYAAPAVTALVVNNKTHCTGRDAYS